MSDDPWEVLINGKVRRTDLESLQSWLRTGWIRPEDQVRRGEMAWVAAREVPELQALCAGLASCAISTSP